MRKASASDFFTSGSWRGVIQFRQRLHPVQMRVGAFIANHFDLIARVAGRQRFPGSIRVLKPAAVFGRHTCASESCDKGPTRGPAPPVAAGAVVFDEGVNRERLAVEQFAVVHRPAVEVGASRSNRRSAGRENGRAGNDNPAWPPPNNSGWCRCNLQVARAKKPRPCGFA